METDPPTPTVPVTTELPFCTGTIVPGVLVSPSAVAMCVQLPFRFPKHQLLVMIIMGKPTFIVNRPRKEGQKKNLAEGSRLQMTWLRTARPIFFHNAANGFVVYSMLTRDAGKVTLKFKIPDNLSAFFVR
jgi:hypothetical protein